MPFGGGKQHFGLIFAEEKWPFVEIFDGWPSFYSLFFGIFQIKFIPLPTKLVKV